MASSRNILKPMALLQTCSFQPTRMTQVLTITALSTLSVKSKHSSSIYLICQNIKLHTYISSPATTFLDAIHHCWLISPILVSKPAVVKRVKEKYRKKSYVLECGLYLLVALVCHRAFTSEPLYFTNYVNYICIFNRRLHSQTF